MKLILSRKGFDSAAGGVPSPILDGRAVSLPIPEGAPDGTSYADLGLEIVEALTRGRIPKEAVAHADPMAQGGRVFFGQAEIAQFHLDAHQVGPGDVFLFFGLFQDRTAARGHPDRSRHHRIFGWMRVEQVFRLGSDPRPEDAPGVPAHHPHIRRRGQSASNTIWAGPGRLGAPASESLRLTVPGSPPSTWKVPSWLREVGLSYHDAPHRWGDERLQAASRGQEFVCFLPEDVRHPSHGWLAQVIDGMT